METALIWLLFVGIFTVPLYAGVTLLAWLLLRRWTTSIIALAIAVGAVGFVAITIPVTVNIQAERARAALPADIIPPRPLHLRGDLRIEVIDSYNGRYAWGQGNLAKYEGGYVKPRTCGHFCRTLLAIPGVTSVTIDPPSVRTADTPSAAAVTYRRADEGCVSPVDQSAEPITFATKIGLYDESSCVAGYRPIQHATFRMVSVRLEEEGQPFVQRIEIWNSIGKVVLRSSSPKRASALTVPLMIEFTFNQHAGPFELARTYEPENFTLSANPWYPANTLLRLTTGAAQRKT